MDENVEGEIRQLRLELKKPIARSRGCIGR